MIEQLPSVSSPLDLFDFSDPDARQTLITAITDDFKCRRKIDIMTQRVSRDQETGALILRDVSKSYRATIDEINEIEIELALHLSRRGVPLK